MATLRLLKVIVQPVFVLDHGDSLTEHVADPVIVPAADWSSYPTTGFAEAFRVLRAEVEAQQPNLDSER